MTLPDFPLHRSYGESEPLVPPPQPEFLPSPAPSSQQSNQPSSSSSNQPEEESSFPLDAKSKELLAKAMQKMMNPRLPFPSLESKEAGQKGHLTHPEHELESLVGELQQRLGEGKPPLSKKEEQELGREVLGSLKKGAVAPPLRQELQNLAQLEKSSASITRKDEKQEVESASLLKQEVKTTMLGAPPSPLRKESGELKERERVVQGGEGERKEAPLREKKEGAVEGGVPGAIQVDLHGIGSGAVASSGESTVASQIDKIIAAFEKSAQYGGRLVNVQASALDAGGTRLAMALANGVKVQVDLAPGGRELNILIQGLTPEQQSLLESTGAHDQLRKALQEKGFTVHVIQTERGEGEKYKKEKKEGEGEE